MLVVIEMAWDYIFHCAFGLSSFEGRIETPSTHTLAHTHTHLVAKPKRQSAQRLLSKNQKWSTSRKSTQPLDTRAVRTGLRIIYPS